MSNYESCTRTNYFTVSNEEKLKDIVEHIKWENGELDFLNKENGKWAFGGCGSICGLGSSDDEWEPNDVYEALQKIIVPGDAIIITEIGHEKLGYLNAYSVIITCDEIEVEELRTRAILKACEMLNNPKYDTQMEY